MRVDDEVLGAIRAHARNQAPKEACGLVIIHDGRQLFVPMTNRSEKPLSTFRIGSEDFADAEDLGEVACIVHSHVNESPEPSDCDRVECERSGFPWLIVNAVTGDYTITEPSGFKAPLVGRQFSEGVLDCYELVKDYYTEVCGIQIPSYDRSFTWWQNGINLIGDNFRDAGFYPVEMKDLRLHDGLIMRIDSRVPNHVGVYVGNNLILHHLKNRLSSRDVYGGYWRQVTLQAVRHKDVK